MNKLSFEQEIKTFFDKYNIKYKDETNSTTSLDFKYMRRDFIFKFDAKEKMQKYNMSNWTDEIDEKDCFIVDELGIRKVMRSGTNSGIIIRNNMSDEYVFFSFLDLFSMPKIRVNRKTNALTNYLKGKWIIDLNNGIRCKTLEEIFVAIKRYETEKEKLFFQGERYKIYSGETSELKGITRTNYYKRKDYSTTR